MIRPRCSCGKNCKPNGRTVNGDIKYYKLCSSCRTARELKYKKDAPKSRADFSKWIRRFKGDLCESCGFIPEHSCQLDVDHIDGSRDNNNIDNYQTLCANCHRLKTYKNKDWEIKSR